MSGRKPIALCPALALLALVGCPGRLPPNETEGGVVVPDMVRREGPVVKGDRPRAIDLPVLPNVPCLSGQCGKNLICMANICLKTCTQPSPGCNEKVAACGARESCMGASSFTDACYPANAELDQACNYEQAVFCVQGTLCVRLTTGGTPKCLKLCKYTCPAGTSCRSTNNGCQVCIPF